MAEARFTVTYDGPEVERGRMDATVLGGAMVAMGNLVEHSAAILSKGDTPVTVEVSAEFRTGSFSYQILTTTPEVIGAAQALASSVSLNDVLHALGVTVGGGGLIGLLRFLKGRKPKSIEVTNGSHNAVVTTEDGDSTVIHAHTVHLYRNSTILVDMNGVVAPLEREGITELRVGNQPVASNTIRQDELGYFEAPAPVGEVLQDKETEEIVEIVGINFVPGKKWRLALADGTSFTSRLDASYAKKVVPGGERFGAGDVFRVMLHTVVVREPSGALRAQREVVRVIQHYAAPTQLGLNMSDGPE